RRKGWRGIRDTRGTERPARSRVLPRQSRECKEWRRRRSKPQARKHGFAGAKPTNGRYIRLTFQGTYRPYTCSATHFSPTMVNSPRPLYHKTHAPPFLLSSNVMLLILPSSFMCTTSSTFPDLSENFNVACLLRKRTTVSEGFSAYTSICV